MGRGGFSAEGDGEVGQEGGWHGNLELQIFWSNEFVEYS